MSNKCDCIPSQLLKGHLTPKLIKIIAWMVKNADYFESAQFAKITLNLKNENIQGEINIFPDHKL